MTAVLDPSSTQALRLIGETALRMAEGKAIERDWLIEQFDSAIRSDAGKQPLPHGQLLTIPEASTRLRISRWSIYDLIHKRQLLSVKIGRRRFVPGSEITRYINSLPLSGGHLL